DDDRDPGAELVCSAQLAIEPAVRNVEHGADACVTDEPRGARRVARLRGLDRAHQHLGHRGWIRGDAKLASDEQYAFDAKRVTGRGRVGQTKYRGEPVVAAAATERVLRAMQVLVPKLEHGVGVVVETANQTR